MKLLITLTALTLAAYLASCKGIDYTRNSSDSSNNSTNDSNNDNSDHSINDSYNPETSEQSPSLPSNPSNLCLSSNPDCTVLTIGPDGPSGFTWKAVSDSDQNLVILFPSAYCTKFLSVSVLTLTGEVEKGTFADFTNPNRQTYRFSKPGEAYTGRIIIEEPDHTCFAQVPNPELRQD